MIGALEQSRNPKNRDALRRRAEAGDAPAQYALAKMFLESQPPDYDHGMEWLRKAAEQGDDEVQQNYAHNLLGLRGAAGAQEALRWYTRSAAQGNREAQFRLGLLLYEGKLVPRDELTACQWALLAAGNGHFEARDLLKEMELFPDKTKLTEARRRAAEFKPKQAESATSRN
jgi:TPR repeat protein